MADLLNPACRYFMRPSDQADHVTAFRKSEDAREPRAHVLAWKLRQQRLAFSQWFGEVEEGQANG